MERELKICGVLLLVLIVLNVSLLFFGTPNSTQRVTGAGITASVSFVIETEAKHINIFSPLNQTYNFDLGEPLVLDLNVSSNFNAVSWWYDLYDLKHGKLVNQSIAFIPNQSIGVVRWGNQLTVYAQGEDDEIVNSTVVFSVYVPNSAPIISGIPENIYVCENTQLIHFFNVTDIDEDVLWLTTNPTGPFHASPLYTKKDMVTTVIEFFSGILLKKNVGTYFEIISVTDGEYLDTAETNINILEVNNNPVMRNIGVKTVYTEGSNTTFNYTVNVSDIEDGTSSEGKLNFSLIFWNGTELFGITSFGEINYAPIVSELGVYTIGVCATDLGITNPHVNISLCGQDGGPITTCQNFSLTVTSDNRAPTIISYSPLILSSTRDGGSSVKFSVTNYDPDGTVPDTYWYVNNKLVEYDVGNLNQDYTYSVPCGVNGDFNVKVDVTDGMLNDSLTWNFAINPVVCPVSSGGGGGGGGSGPSCTEKWACFGWSICQDSAKSLEIGLLSGEDFRIIQGECSRNAWFNKDCGVQTRTCSDINFCNTTYNRPDQYSSCQYTINPSCNDGIKNCHNDSCELLVDCGGPCAACPTCSDRIKNQGEENIDCGGPCPIECPAIAPFVERNSFLIVFVVLILILIIIAGIKIYRIINYKKREKKHAK